MRAINYIIENERDLQWGLSVNTIGYEEIVPNMPYPTPGHAPGYSFSPEKGRILHEYQLLYLLEGKGTLVTQSKGEIPVKSGNMFLLFPNEWHTYWPEKETGWKLYWIGFKGAHMDDRVLNGFLSKENPLFQVGYNATLVHLYHQAIETVQREEACFQQLLAGIVNYLLGFMYSIDRNLLLNKDHSSTKLIDHARIYMREKVEENLSAKDVAAHLGMGYSHFRKLFKAYTGLSPSQYYLDLKLQHAKELLNRTLFPIKEIAYKLQFQSPDYFSTLFKKKTGYTPSEFRMKK